MGEGVLKMSHAHRRENGFALILVLLVLAVASALAAPLLAQTIAGRAGVRQAEARQQAYELAVSGLELVQWHYAEMRRKGELPSDPQAAMQAVVERVNASPHKAYLPGSVELRLESADPPHVVMVSTGMVDSVRPDGGTKPVTATVRATFRRIAGTTFLGGVYFVTEMDLGTGPNSGKIQDDSGNPVPAQQISAEEFQQLHGQLLRQFPLLSPAHPSGNIMRSGRVVVEGVVEGDLVVNGDVDIKSNAMVTGRLVATGNVTVLPHAQNVRIQGGIVAGRDVTIESHVRQVQIPGGIHAQGKIEFKSHVQHGDFGSLVSKGDIVLDAHVSSINVRGSMSSNGKIVLGSHVKDLVVFGPILGGSHIEISSQVENVVVHGSVVSHDGNVEVSSHVQDVTVHGYLVAGLNGRVMMAAHSGRIVVTNAVVGHLVEWGPHVQAITVGGIAGDRITVGVFGVINVHDSQSHPEGGPGSEADLVLEFWEVP